MRFFQIASTVLVSFGISAALAACGGDGDGNGKTDGNRTAGGGASGSGASGSGASGASGGGSTGGGGSVNLPPPPPTCPPPVSLADVSSPKAKVGNGTAASCTEAALDTVLPDGGTIVFDCGPDPVTITLGSAKQIKSDTVIDGGGKVTLSGGKKNRIFFIDTGNYEATTPKLTVQRLTFRDGHAEGTQGPLGTEVDGGGGAIYHNGGTVVAIDSVFLDNECALEGPDVAGGAIYGVGLGETVIVGSTFSGNRGANGGAIGGLGTSITIYNSTIEGNEATGRGANYIDSNGQQAGRGGNGGAICMDGKGRTLDICGTRVANNKGGAFGGALFRTGYASEPTTIHRSTFDGNSIPDHADENLPSGAGGLYIQGTKVTMTATTISNNEARGFAGMWILGHGGDSPATADLTNVTLTGNRTYPNADFTKRGIGGGLTIGDDTTGTILNCTIVGNSAQFASGILRVSPLTVRNTIISNEAENQYTPLNCMGDAFATPPGTGERNIQWPNGPMNDMDCTPGITRADPKMGALADNGGPTKTIAPEAGSPAIGMGTNCPATDQRGQVRDTATCTLGAMEP
jgi:hypothetical protein